VDRRELGWRRMWRGMKFVKKRMRIEKKVVGIEVFILNPEPQNTLFRMEYGRLG